jgi:quercetin dioxygenase-like cupin family protein
MTKNREYTDAVSAGHPPKRFEVPLDDHFDNHNGSILNVLFGDVKSVARIESCKGAVRANHWHKTDDHYTYVESGAVIYAQHDLIDGKLVNPGAAQTFKAGQMFYTPPGKAHAMVFPVDSVIWTFARNVRDHEHHEEDVVRIEVVSRTFADQLIADYQP